jgi:methylmalonyl-CoA mutase
VIVGVNKYRRDKEEPIDILDVDNVKVRAGQIKALEAKIGALEVPENGSAKVCHGSGGIVLLRAE